MKNYNLKCSICSCDFVGLQPWAKYCSLKCKNKNARLKLATKHCQRCNKEYKPSSTKQKYCKASCGLKAVSITKVLTCTDCNEHFEFIGRCNARRCIPCRKLYATKKSYKSMVKTGKIKKPGVGSGGNQFGENNHRWLPPEKRKGKYISGYRRICFSYWPKRCMVCAITSKIEVHHVDGDIANNLPYNLIPVCQNCHKKIHSKNHSTKEQYEQALFKLWQQSRSKIAEIKREYLKIGNPR